MKNCINIDPRVSKKSLNRFFEELKGISCDLYAMEIYKDGDLMLSLAPFPYSTADKREVYSLSKSFTSTAIGILVTEGKLSLDDKLIDIFPDKVPADISDKMSRVRVRHILSMNTGHSSCTATRVFASDDAVREFMSIEPEYEPGTHFTYNTGASCILSCITERVSGMRLLDFLTFKLFVPLGIKGIHWNHVRSGQNEGGCGIYISVDDIAKLGLLYLGGGVYGGKRYLSEEYVREATSAVSDNSRGGSKDWRAGYGFQFWRCADGGFRGDGAYGQYCYVLPEKNVVAAVQASVGDMQSELNALCKLVSSLTDEDGEEELILPKYKPFYSEERVPSFVGKYYSLENNPMGWNGVYFDYDPMRDELDAVFTDGYDHAVLKAGRGHYVFCDFTAIRFQPKIHFTSDTDHSRLASSYRITDGYVEIEARFLNCPHKLIITSKADSDGKHIDISLTCGNINMGPSSHLVGTLAE